MNARSLLAGVLTLALAACSQPEAPKAPEPPAVQAPPAAVPGPIEPPEPGTPGGLPDDRTPLDEGSVRRPDSPQAAAGVLETYYSLLESGRAAEAAKLRLDRRPEDLSAYSEFHAQIGRPVAVPGSSPARVRVPVSFYGWEAAGSPFAQAGVVTLQRIVVDGAVSWRVERVDRQPIVRR